MILPYLKELGNEREKTQSFQLTPSVSCKQIPAYLFNRFYIWVAFKIRPSTKMQKCTDLKISHKHGKQPLSAKHSRTPYGLVT